MSTDDDAQIYFRVAPTRPFLRSIPPRPYISTTPEKRRRAIQKYICSVSTLLQLIAILMYAGSSTIFYMAPKCRGRKVDPSYRWILPVTNTVFILAMLMLYVVECLLIWRNRTILAIDVGIAFGLTQLALVSLVVVVTMYRCHVLQHIIAELISIIAAVMMFSSALAAFVQLSPSRSVTPLRQSTTLTNGTVMVHTFF